VSHVECPENQHERQDARNRERLIVDLERIWGVLALPPVQARPPAMPGARGRSVSERAALRHVPRRHRRCGRARAGDKDADDGQPALCCGARVLPGSTRASGARCGARLGAEGSAAHAGPRRAFVFCSLATLRASCASTASCTVLSNAVAAHGGGGERDVPARARRRRDYVLTAPRDLHYGGTATS
jgi:hypothetical protein